MESKKTIKIIANKINKIDLFIFCLIFLVIIVWISPQV